MQQGPRCLLIPKPLTLPKDPNLYADRSCPHTETEDCLLLQERPEAILHRGQAQATGVSGGPVRAQLAPPCPLPLTLLALAQALQGRVAMPDVLPAEPALAGAGPVAGTGGTIPGTVRVPGQAALCTGTAVSLTLVQLQPGHTQPRAHIQHLLGGT